MPQRFASRSVADPVALVLIKLLQSLNYQNYQAENRSDHSGRPRNGHRDQRSYARSNKLHDLNALNQNCAYWLFWSYQLIWSSSRWRVCGVVSAIGGVP